MPSQLPVLETILSLIFIYFVFAIQMPFVALLATLFSIELAMLN